MGLSDTRQRMRVGFEAIANDLTDVTARLETDNASAAQFTLRLRLPDASRIMNTDWRAAHIALRSWQVEDAGFVMSRNWFCARSLICCVGPRWTLSGGNASVLSQRPLAWA